MKLGGISGVGGLFKEGGTQTLDEAFRDGLKLTEVETAKPADEPKGVQERVVSSGSSPLMRIPNRITLRNKSTISE